MDTHPFSNHTLCSLPRGTLSLPTLFNHSLSVSLNLASNHKLGLSKILSHSAQGSSSILDTSSNMARSRPNLWCIPRELFMSLLSNLSLNPRGLFMNLLSNLSLNRDNRRQKALSLKKVWQRQCSCLTNLGSHLSYSKASSQCRRLTNQLLRSNSHK